VSTLPETDDPFMLLGLGAGADQEAIRDAYARRIAEFPAEVAPRERARIEAAFARVRMFEGSAAPTSAPEPARDGGDLRERFAAMIEAGQFDELWREVTRPGRFDAALQSVELGPVVLPVFGALAWRNPAAQQLGPKFMGLVPPPAIAYLVARVAQELLVAHKFHELRRSGGLMTPPGDVPPALVDLFSDDLIATPARIAATFAAVRPLLAQPDVLLGICDRLAWLDPWLAATLLERLRQRSKDWSDRALDSIPWSVREDLERRVTAVRDPGRYLRYVTYGFLGTASVTLYFSINADLGGVVALPALAAVGVGILAERLVSRADKRRYARIIRPQYVPLLAELGVQADCISAITRENPALNRRFSTYDGKLRDDVGLALFGAIATLVREDERGPAAPPRR
jgi:hypothetical protein